MCGERGGIPLFSIGTGIGIPPPPRALLLLQAALAPGQAAGKLRPMLRAPGWGSRAVLQAVGEIARVHVRVGGGGERWHLLAFSAAAAVAALRNLRRSATRCGAGRGAQGEGLLPFIPPLASRVKKAEQLRKQIL